MTKEERRLWYSFLREYRVKFLRQKILGNYIVDFYCAKANLVIELDGSQHYEERNLQSDLLREKYLSQYGIYVLRFSNLEIKENFSAVCERIDEVVCKRFHENQKQ